MKDVNIEQPINCCIELLQAASRHDARFGAWLNIHSVVSCASVFGRTDANM